MDPDKELQFYHFSEDYLKKFKYEEPVKFKSYKNSYLELSNELDQQYQPAPIEIELLTHSDPHVVMCFKDNDFVGMARYSKVMNFYKYKADGLGNFYYIDNVMVSKKFQGQGFCSKILQKLFEINPDFEKYILTVDETNVPAIKCYTRHGFKILDKEKGVMTMYKKLKLDGGKQDYYNKYKNIKLKYLQEKKKIEKGNI